jgi:hypothetical protein
LGVGLALVRKGDDAMTQLGDRLEQAQTSVRIRLVVDYENIDGNGVRHQVDLRDGSTVSCRGNAIVWYY